MDSTNSAQDTAIVVKLHDNGVADVIMNRADKHNAFDDQVITDLTAALQSLNDNEAVRLVCLRATGKSFSAGADLNWMRRMADYNRAENFADSMELAGLMKTLHGMRQPTIAVVQGAAFGGGVGLVACCDIAIASDRASFCLSEVKLGLIPAVISPYVIAAMGARQAQRYFLSAERFRADEAARIGLIHQVVALEQLDDTVAEMVLTLLQNSPTALTAAKQLISRVSSSTLDDQLIEDTAHRIADMRASIQGKEGVSAFLEKRRPDWIDGS